MTSWRRILIYRRLGAISVLCGCEPAVPLVSGAENRGRHDSSVDFDGFWWAVVYQKDDNYCWGELLKFPHKGRLGSKSTECATMMTVYLLLLTVRMTRIITTIILTEAHEMAVRRIQRLHLL
nr:uncharacterized protein LOC110142869 isoform X1 [Odocoileus virginianus texanus]